MKILLTLFVLLFSSSVVAEEIVLECKWDVHAKDYTEDNRWITFDQMQKFKLTIKKNEMVLYDYLLGFNWKPPFEIKNNNKDYIIGTVVENLADGPSTSFITYTKQNGYTVMMSSDYVFGLTVQTGYCR